jgi:hypothetical protein
VAEAEGGSVLLIAKAALRQMLRNELSSYRWQARSDHARCGVGVTAPFLILWPARGEEVRSLLAPLFGWFTKGYETAALQAARALGAYDEKKSMRSEFASV